MQFQVASPREALDEHAELAEPLAGAYRFRIMTVGAERIQDVERFFALSADLMCIADGNGCLQRTNPAWERLLGRREDELLGRSLVDLAHLDERDTVIAALSALQDGTPVSWEMRCQHRDGLWLWLSWRCVRAAGGGAIYGVGRDISRAKQDALACSDGLFWLRESQRVAHIGSYVLDVGSGRWKSSEILDDIFGIDAAYDRTVLGWAALVHPEDRDAMLAYVKTDVLERGARFDRKYRIVRRRDGDVRWVQGYGEVARDAAGTPTHMMGTIQDVTDRTRVEQALAAEKELLRATLRSIGDGVITTDNGARVVLMNRVAEQMTGWTNGEAAGRPVAEVFRVVAEGTQKPRPSPVGDTLRRGATVELANHTLLLSRDGSERNIADSSAPIRDREGRVVGAVLVFRDVTERTRIEESLRNAQRFEALSLLAAGIAHDFNNLLSGVFGFVDLAREDVKANAADGALGQLDKAIALIAQARGLALQLITFAKGGAPLKQRLSIASLIAKSARFVLSGANVTAKLELADDLWTCNGDEAQLGQVLNNVLINARQAMPGGGVVTVRANNLAEESPRPSGLGAGKFVYIEIEDNGPGIPARDIKRVFDPFFTTKTQGSGLGLSMAYSALARHGGHIEARSEPGRGATFCIYLPALVRASAPAPGAPGVATPAGQRHILVVDDEESVRYVAVEMLKRLGYTSMSAPDGFIAVQLVADGVKTGRRFDAAIVDLTIPGGLGGKEALSDMLAADPELKAIASSGYIDDPIMSDPTRFGFHEKLPKPYLLDDLGDVLARMLSPSLRR